MFSDPGISALGFQLEIYRWEDHFRRMREIRENNSNLAVAHRQLEWIADQHSQLAGRYNKLVSAANQLADHARALERGTQDRDERIAELERRLAGSRQEVKFLRDAAHDRFCAEMDLLKEKEQQNVLRSQEA